MSLLWYREYVIEVIDNEDRLKKISTIARAAVDDKVQNFIVCGSAGAFKLSNDPDSKRLYDELGDSIGKWLKPAEWHLSTQELAFASHIPIIAKLSPPEIYAGVRTGTYSPSKNVMGAGVDSVSYEDVADVFMTALPKLEYYDRAMIGSSKTNKEL